jgi:hypothetical protein
VNALERQHEADQARLAMDRETLARIDENVKQLRHDLDVALTRRP